MSVIYFKIVVSINARYITGEQNDAFEKLY